MSSRYRRRSTITTLERGEEITLTYTDWGPSGADSVGDDDREVELSIETSNFGATLELDQNVYTWTDKVFITVVASDYNFDSNVIDEIGDEGDGEITVRIRSNDIKEYNLAETGPDTGVFTGELTLVGTEYEAGDNINVSERITRGDGPTDGIIEANNGGRTQRLLRVLRFGSPTGGLCANPMERRRGAVA